MGNTGWLCQTGEKNNWSKAEKELDYERPRNGPGIIVIREGGFYFDKWLAIANKKSNEMKEKLCLTSG